MVFSNKHDLYGVRRHSGYEVEGHYMSLVDSMGLITRIPPKITLSNRVLDASGPRRPPGEQKKRCQRGESLPYESRSERQPVVGLPWRYPSSCVNPNAALAPRTKPRCSICLNYLSARPELGKRPQIQTEREYVQEVIDFRP